MQDALESIRTGDLESPFGVNLGEGQSGDESPHSKNTSSDFFRVFRGLCNSQSSNLVNDCTDLHFPKNIDRRSGPRLT